MLDQLTKKFQTWCAEQGLPLMSANELVLKPDVTADQQAWLLDFVAEWEIYEN